MMKFLGKLLVAAMLIGWFGLVGAATDEEKVLYHINDSAVARAALGNIRNHLNATEGKVKIVVVTHGPGVDFLLDGAADKSGNPYNIAVEELMAQGVDFRVCNNTLKARHIDLRTVQQGAKIVPSGVAEIGKLQAKEGFAYIKP